MSNLKQVQYYRENYIQKIVKFNKFKYPKVVNWIKSQKNFTKSFMFIANMCINLYGEQDIFEALNKKYKENKMENV